jgi:hypothetical protein
MSFLKAILEIAEKRLFPSVRKSCSVSQSENERITPEY